MRWLVLLAALAASGCAAWGRAICGEGKHAVECGFCFDFGCNCRCVSDSVDAGQ